MAGAALLARAAGHRVSGSDTAIYPPMSTQLAEAGLVFTEGYDPGDLEPVPDCVVVGNVMRRGQPIVEHMLDAGMRYTSGPQWLAENILQGRWVLAVAGTHGKTTTSAMLTWILEDAGLSPGFLIGGVPGNFGCSAGLGSGPFFVVEADEYDTAFFDKRSKFVHYRPRTVVLNNLEFDHADIFHDLQAIETQFHHLVRTIPGNGLIVMNGMDANLNRVLEMGCWTPVERFGDGAWQARNVTKGGGEFDVCLDGGTAEGVRWSQLGMHNVHNALAAIAAARHAGVPPERAAEALSRFKGVKRRLELRGEVRGVKVFDDFAHHPTAISMTVAAVRARTAGGRLHAVLEPRSNTMRMGVHRDALSASLRQADKVYLLRPDSLDWDLEGVTRELGSGAAAFETVGEIVDRVVADAQASDVVLVMSNGGFENIHQRLLDALGKT